MTIANPIYDVVFKYLMEDTRIARTILSALLKKDIVRVEVRPGQINNRLDEVLSVFDQTRQREDNQHVLEIDDEFYPEDDVDMQRILRRLLMAATDADMRMDMNVEDEYFSIIEKQDTEILMRTRELAETNARLKQTKVQLEQKDAQLGQKDAQLERQDAQLQQQEAFLRSSIHMLLKAGLSIEAIAIQCNKSIEDVKRLAE